MNNILIIFSLLIFNLTFSQNSIVGKWETYDDETNELKSIVEIYKKGTFYFGKINEVLVKGKPKLCTICEGDKKDAPVIGLVIIENMQADDDAQYSGGSILDPESGTTYKCLLELENENKLKVRGYIGFALLGRTQYWKRKK